MRGIAILKRLEALEERAAVKRQPSEAQKRYRRAAAFLRNDPEFVAIAETIGKTDVNRPLSERLDSPEKIEAAKRITGRLEALREIVTG